MEGPTIRFPVTCPKCGEEHVDEYPIAEVAAALLSHGPLRLFASCHKYSWNATRTEVDQIREYLGTATLGAMQTAGRLPVIR
jgi:hypothetical protein